LAGTIRSNHPTPGPFLSHEAFGRGTVALTESQSGGKEKKQLSDPMLIVTIIAIIIRHTKNPGGRGDKRG
jgi:hypothetical protein